MRAWPLVQPRANAAPIAMSAPPTKAKARRVPTETRGPFSTVVADPAGEEAGEERADEGARDLEDEPGLERVRALLEVRGEELVRLRVAGGHERDEPRDRRVEGPGGPEAAADEHEGREEHEAEADPGRGTGSCRDEAPGRMPLFLRA